MIETPHWQLLHEWRVDDISYEIKDKEFFIEMLRMHPEDEIGAGYREIIKLIEKCIKTMKKEYKSVYGTYPKLGR